MDWFHFGGSTIDLSGIVAAVDAGDVIASLTAVAAVVAVVLWASLAIRFVLGMIDNYHEKQEIDREDFEYYEEYYRDRD